MQDSVTGLICQTDEMSQLTGGERIMITKCISTVPLILLLFWVFQGCTSITQLTPEASAIFKGEVPAALPEDVWVEEGDRTYKMWDGWLYSSNDTFFIRGKVWSGALNRRGKEVSLLLENVKRLWIEEDYMIMTDSGLVYDTEAGSCFYAIYKGRLSAIQCMQCYADTSRTGTMDWLEKVHIPLERISQVGQSDISTVGIIALAIPAGIIGAFFVGFFIL